MRDFKKDTARIPEKLPGEDITFDDIGDGKNITTRRAIGVYRTLAISVAILTMISLLADFIISPESTKKKGLTSTIVSSFLAVDVPQDIKNNTTSQAKDTPTLPSRDVLESLIIEETDEPSSNADISYDTNTTESSTTPNEIDNTSEKYPIVKLDLSGSELGEYYISNETGYSPNISDLLNSDYKIKIQDTEKDPVVLIIHTHGTESYADEGDCSYTYDGGDISRSKDKEKNVIAIGSIMTDILNQNGVNTLHCETMHDEESYEESYSRAADTIKSHLTKHPSIQYIFDVHRDAILKSDGTLVGAVCKIDGENVAQVMAVVGSNYKGANFPDWEDHLALALKLRSNLNSKFGNISRPVYLRGAAYNEQYTPGALLLEIGSSGNTLDEAKKAAKITAEALAEMIKGAS